MEKTSRFNYIKKGIVGVCAATMLTGLCAGAAFGATESKVTLNKDSSALQIDVTVPTELPVTIDKTAGVQMPTTGISITNNNKAIEIAVEKATIASPASNLLLTEKPADGTSLTTNQMWMTLKNGAEANFIDVSKAGDIPLNWTVGDGIDLTLDGSMGPLSKDLLGSSPLTANLDLFKITWVVSQA
ncbi:hypothetical protein C1878_13215 [Gordonibacter sp. 28C]|uniref:hypothetical protein n=1 Tax=Gordonibacter sp. 28C TaxID=2078569 RepID=UPI000DF7D764|nr:hypothetical protein [Gordonibacter sp. 28C]RDB60800.1 hypothetical protein C1878_13215 [Gordonibacter sp. 28C]